MKKDAVRAAGIMRRIKNPAQLVIFGVIYLTGCALSQENNTINGILDTLNSREYRIEKGNIQQMDQYPHGFGELLENDDYSVYYLIGKTLSNLDSSLALSTGCDLIVYSNNLSSGILLSFSRSHTVSSNGKEYVLNFQLDDLLLGLNKGLIDSSFVSTSNLKIAYLSEDLPDGESPFTYFTYIEVPCERRFSMDGNYCDLELDSLLRLINDSLPLDKK